MATLYVLIVLKYQCMQIVSSPVIKNPFFTPDQYLAGVHRWGEKHPLINFLPGMNSGASMRLRLCNGMSTGRCGVSMDLVAEH